MTDPMQYEGWIAWILRRATSSALGLAAVLALVVVATQSAQAQIYTVLHTFRGGTDGSTPAAGLVREVAGSLYGTTANGGDPTCSDGCGTVFKVSPTGKERVLHGFTGADGSVPAAGLVRDSTGNFYGTTAGGGASGHGTVFKLDTNGTETVLHSFTGGADGANPYAGLVGDSAGNLYGTTIYGGDSGLGTVFKLDTAGNETVLHSFAGPDGQYPEAGLVRDAPGNLYGTTAYGGAFGLGTMFEVSGAGKEKVLHSFAGPDGQYPFAGLVRDAAGNLYSTTEGGGASGFGAVFKLDTNGTETVLYTFTGGADGGYPYAALVWDSTGNFYGTTSQGGDLRCNAPYGCGTVFKLDTNGTETVLYAFTGGADGSTPRAGLVRDSAGNLYGTTSQGGDLRCNHPTGCGTVFKIIP